MASSVKEVNALSSSLEADSRKSGAMWSLSVRAGGGVFIPSLLIKGQSRLGLSSSELVVLLHILLHMATSREVAISRRLIADQLGKDVNTVYRVIAALERKGMLEKRKRHTVQGRQIENEYDLSGLARRLRALSSSGEE